MLYISSSCGNMRTIKEVIRALAEKGYRNIELSGGTQYYEGFELDLLELKEIYKLNYLVHNYFPPQREDFVLNLIADDPEIRNKTFHLIFEAINLAKKLDGDLYTLHAGWTRNLLPKKKGLYFNEGDDVILEFRSGIDRLHDSIRDLLNKIDEKNFRFGIENLYPVSRTENFSILCTPEEICSFLSWYSGYKNIGLLFDFGHFNVASNFLNFNKEVGLDKIFSAFSEKIFELHISENDGTGDQHKMTPLDSWQLEFLVQNKKQFKNIPIVFEWNNALDKNSFRRYEEIEKLME